MSKTVDSSSLTASSAQPGFDMKTFEFDLADGLERPRLAVRWGGREAISSAAVIQSIRNLKYSVLYYVLDGEGAYRCGQRRWTVNQGMVFWALAGLDARLDARPAAPLSCYAIMIFGSEVAALFNRYLHEPVGASELLRCAEVQAIAEAIVSEGVDPSEHTCDNTADFTRILLRRIDANMNSPLSNNPTARNTYRKCKRFIASNFDRISSVRQAAEACDITVPYLCRLFDLYGRTTAHEYMTRLKLSKAEYLLLRREVPVKEVANSVGYDDARLFTRNFKTFFGTSPRAYRKTYASEA